MFAPPLSASLTRWSVALLLLALAPSLTYVGHWEPRFDIPFTDYYWGVPARPGHSHQHDDSSHGEHCHGDSSCSERPVTAGAGVALLRADAEMLGMGALLLLVLAAVAMPALPGARAPETPPPRTPLPVRAARPA